VVLDSFDFVTIDYWGTNPFNISSCISTPFKSNYIVNVQNTNDNECFNSGVSNLFNQRVNLNFKSCWRAAHKVTLINNLQNSIYNKH